MKRLISVVVLLVNDVSIEASQALRRPLAQVIGNPLVLQSSVRLMQPQRHFSTGNFKPGPFVRKIKDTVQGGWCKVQSIPDYLKFKKQDLNYKYGENGTTIQVPRIMRKIKNEVQNIWNRIRFMPEYVRFQKQRVVYKYNALKSNVKQAKQEASYFVKQMKDSGEALKENLSDRFNPVNSGIINKAEMQIKKFGDELHLYQSVANQKLHNPATFTKGKLDIIVKAIDEINATQSSLSNFARLHPESKRAQIENETYERYTKDWVAGWESIKYDLYWELPQKIREQLQFEHQLWMIGFHARQQEEIESRILKLEEDYEKYKKVLKESIFLSPDNIEAHAYVTELGPLIKQIENDYSQELEKKIVQEFASDRGWYKDDLKSSNPRFRGYRAILDEIEEIIRNREAKVKTYEQAEAYQDIFSSSRFDKLVARIKKRETLIMIEELRAIQDGLRQEYLAQGGRTESKKQDSSYNNSGQKKNLNFKAEELLQDMLKNPLNYILAEDIKISDMYALQNAIFKRISKNTAIPFTDQKRVLLEFLNDRTVIFGLHPDRIGGNGDQMKVFNILRDSFNNDKV